MSKTKTETKTVKLVADRFKPESVGGRMCALLLDGKARTVAEIAKASKVASRKNILGGGGWFFVLKRHGQRSGLYDLIKTDDDKIQLVKKAKAR